jgi:hypothetical protein
LVVESSGTPVFNIRDEFNRARAEIHLIDDGAVGIVLTDRWGTGRVALYSHADGTSWITTPDEDGNPTKGVVDTHEQA